ncbi:MAG: FAD-dependent oxidoreductase [Proteobacteria bacterium]|nr:FAD-dependent oxidoreductase [Pseudomonadota bacterium]
MNVLRPIRCDVAVLGAGPAGVGAAVQLARAGYAVTLVGSPRRAALEGLSVRAQALLRELALEHAAAAAGPPYPRRGRWGGSAIDGGAEHVLTRGAFDAGLLKDARKQGVTVETSRGMVLDQGGDTFRVALGSRVLEARALIDARGRARRGALIKGPKLVAVAQALRRCRELPRGTFIVPLEGAWCWSAVGAQGAAVLQVVTAPTGLARRLPVPDLLRHALGALAREEPAFTGAQFAGRPAARAAHAQCHAELGQTPGQLCIGDAAVAAEPLSGHGMFEALAWAPAAAAGIRTHLEGGAWAPVREFLRSRALERWDHAVRLAAGFYRQQAHAAQDSFWDAIATQYESLAGRAARPHAQWVERAVLNGTRIERRPVAVTPQHPRGVWQLARVDLAALRGFLEHAPRAAVHEAATHLRCDPDAVAQALNFLSSYGLLTAGCDGGAAARLSVTG